MTDDELLPCPFCGGHARIGDFDDEGNYHPREYEKDPWSGLSFALLHDEKDADDSCPIATHDGELLGMFLYDTRTEAAAAWNRRAALGDPAADSGSRVRMGELQDTPEAEERAP
jgi:hypothetical protein